jgi:hypothetical protein
LRRARRGLLRRSRALPLVGWRLLAPNTSSHHATRRVLLLRGGRGAQAWLALGRVDGGGARRPVGVRG